MTRINTLDPLALTDQHLMAEYRELPMVMASLRRSLASKRGLPVIPPRYTLDRGHVCFFYDKRDWLERRYAALVAELRARGFQLDPGRVVDFSVYEHVPCVSWEVDAQARRVNAARILARIEAGPGVHRYRGEVIDVGRYREWLLSFVEAGPGLPDMTRLMP